MSASVPTRRTETPITDILIGEPVRGQTWMEIALLLHWLRGHGMQVIPAHAPQMYLTSGTAASLHYRVKPQGLAIARIWVVELRQVEDAGYPSVVEITLPSGATASENPGLDYGRKILFETVSKTSAQTDLTLTFQRTSGTTAVWIESVTCYELPRGVLTLDATDYGVDLETVRPGAPLYDAANASIGAIAENLTRAISWPRRMLWQQSFPLLESDPGGASNPTAWVDLFPFALPVLPRRVAVGDSSYTIAWDVRVIVGTGGDKFAVRITTGNNAATATVVATNTSEAWIGPSTVELDCEDVSTADGVPGGGLETIQIAVRRTAGSGKISIRSVAAWEAT